MTKADDNVLPKSCDLKAKLIADPSGNESNKLLSQFFRGLPISQLGELLRETDERVISSALFIAEELDKMAAPVLDDIVPHVKHPNPDIRRAAYEAISSCAFGETENSFVHVVGGLRDSDPLCRKIAMLMMIRVPRDLLVAAMRSLENAPAEFDLRQGLHMLLGDSAGDAATIRSWILDQNALIRKVGVIAAGRLGKGCQELLELAARSDDPDLRLCATAHLKFMEIRTKHGRC